MAVCTGIFSIGVWDLPENMAAYTARRQGMSDRSRRFHVSGRVYEEEQARVDAAARLKGVSRGDYVRAAVLRQAQRDLREAAGEGEPGTDR